MPPEHADSSVRTKHHRIDSKTRLCRAAIRVRRRSVQEAVAQPLARVLHRCTEASASTDELAGQLGQAAATPIEGPAHGDGPGADYFLAVLAADLQHQRIE